MSIDARDGRGVAEDGFHEIQLSGKQLVFLFMATTVVSVVIFLCGVLVGRGARAEGSGPAADVTPQAGALTDAAGSEGLPVGRAQRPEATPPLPAEEPTPAETIVADELTYPKRLGADRPPADGLRPEATPGGGAAAVTPPGPPAPAQPAAAADPALAPPRSGGRYTVQVAALRERSEAEVIARRLAGRGYPAYVDATTGRSVSMFRVRVGAFKDRREADRLRVRLEKEEQFKPWVTTR
jgi:DedD protein